MKTIKPFLFPPIDFHHGKSGLYPLLISGMVVPVHGGDGGVNISMHGNAAGLLCAIDPYGFMNEGDKHEIFWSDKKIAQVEVGAGDVDERLFLYLATDGIVPPWGENVIYRLTRTGSSQSEDSAGLRLRVKLDRPAGVDREPNFPWHSELLMPGLPQDVIDNGIDADWAAKGVPVEIGHYPSRAAYDTIELKWGSVIVRREVSEAEAGGTAAIIMLIGQDTILAGGDSDALLVRYQVFDEVWNFSVQWSKPTTVRVDAGAWRLDAPFIKEAQEGVIDLIALGKNDVTVQIVVQNPDFSQGDSITMTWIGSPPTGLPIVHTETVRISSVPDILELKVPYLDVRAIAQGVADASYVLNKANGTPPQSSKRTFARVEGVVSQLPAPTVLELTGDILEPEIEVATVLIPVYPGMDNGDVIHMVWNGTTVQGTPYVHEQDHIVTAGEVGKVTRFFVANEHIAVLRSGSLDLYYLVSNDAKSIHGVSESDHALIRVAQINAQLPAPLVVEAVDSVLDPTLVPASATLLVGYLGTLAGDELKYYWRGKPGPGTGSDAVPITSITAGKPSTFRIDSSLITPNIGSIVNVRYSLKRKATGLYDYSAVLDLTVGSLIGDLPAPVVLQAPAGVLDPMDAVGGVTVRATYTEMDAELDTITLKWRGTAGAGTSDDLELPGSATGSVDFTVPASVVGPNIGKPVDVTYEVARYGSSSPSELLKLTVSTFRDPLVQLPMPRIAQANDASKELILDSFTGNAGVTVGKWPFGAAGQRVWLSLIGTGSAGAISIPLLTGIAISAGQANSGLNETVMRSELEKLEHNSALTVICKVAFDGSTQEASAIEFPLARYTFKTFDDSIVPVITSVKDAGGIEILPGAATFATSVTLTGTAAPGEQVQVSDAGNSLGTVRATGGIWTLPLTGLTVKAYSITAKALYGSEPVSDPRTFNVAVATKPTITSVRDSKGEVVNGGTTFDTSITVAGKAAAGQQVQVFDGATAVGTPVTVNASGDWTLPMTALSLSAHSITAKGLYGSEPVSDPRTFNVAVATVPTITSVRDSRGEVVNGGSTTDTAVSLLGKAAASEQVQILDNGSDKTRATANTNGDWNASLTGLGLGGHSITAKGLYGSQPVSNSRVFTVNSPTPPLVIDTSSVTLNGKLYSPGVTNPINWPANTTVTRVPTSGAPPYSYSSSNTQVASVSAGVVRAQHNGTTSITVRDSAGQTASYTVSVTGVIECTDLGNLNYPAAVRAAQGIGKRIPSLGELREMHAQYKSNWSIRGTYFWSTTAAGRVLKHWVVSIVTGEEHSAYITVPGGYSYVVAI